MTTRRAALDGLARIMEASALEELFVGSDDDAAFMLELLAETTRGRQASCYWEVCRTARRRGVTPEFVADRASVLFASIEERQRSDVYRMLDVAPLADAEAIRHRWLDIAKREHPDVGGDPERFRRAKEAYELLRDGGRRAEYERYWLRALGPFERVAPRADDVPLEAETTGAMRRVVMIGRRGREAMQDGWGTEAPDAPTGTAADAAAERATLPARLAAVRAAVDRIDAAEIEAMRREIAARVDALEGVRADLAAVVRMRAVIDAATR